MRKTISLILMLLLIPIAMALPNPSAVYCVDRGFTYEIRSSSLGQYGVCIFPNGNECGAWDFYRGDCKVGWHNSKLTGDFNKDGCVNQEDFGYFANHYECKRGDKCYRGFYDLNKDGIIDMGDIAGIFADNYGLRRGKK